MVRLPFVQLPSFFPIPGRRKGGSFQRRAIQPAGKRPANPSPETRSRSAMLLLAQPRPTKYMPPHSYDLCIPICNVSAVPCAVYVCATRRAFTSLGRKVALTRQRCNGRKAALPMRMFMYRARFAPPPAVVEVIGRFEFMATCRSLPRPSSRCLQFCALCSSSSASAIHVMHPYVRAPRSLATTQRQPKTVKQPNIASKPRITKPLKKGAKTIV